MKKIKVFKVLGSESELILEFKERGSEIYNLNVINYYNKEEKGSFAKSKKDYVKEKNLIEINNSCSKLEEFIFNNQEFVKKELITKKTISKINPVDIFFLVENFFKEGKIMKDNIEVDNQNIDESIKIIVSVVDLSKNEPLILEYKNNKFTSKKHLESYLKAEYFMDESTMFLLQDLSLSKTIFKSFLNGDVTSKEMTSTITLLTKWNQAQEEINSLDEKILTTKLLDWDSIKGVLLERIVQHNCCTTS